MKTKSTLLFKTVKNQTSSPKSNFKFISQIPTLLLLVLFAPGLVKAQLATPPGNNCGVANMFSNGTFNDYPSPTTPIGYGNAFNSNAGVNYWGSLSNGVLGTPDIFNVQNFFTTNQPLGNTHAFARMGTQHNPSPANFNTESIFTNVKISKNRNYVLQYQASTFKFNDFSPTTPNIPVDLYYVTLNHYANSYNDYLTAPPKIANTQTIVREHGPTDWTWKNVCFNADTNYERIELAPVAFNPTNNNANYQWLDVTDFSLVELSAGAGNDTTICFGDSAKIGRIYCSKPNASYTWSTATGINNIHQVLQKVAPTATTTYYLNITYTDTITGIVMCQTQDSVKVRVKKLMVLASSCTPNITGNCFSPGCNVSGSVSGGTPPYTFTWSTGLIETGVTTSTLINPHQGNYIFTVSDSMGCHMEANSGVGQIKQTAGFFTSLITSDACGVNASGDALITINGLTSLGSNWAIKFVWSNGVVGTNLNYINNLAPGLYSVKIYEDNIGNSSSCYHIYYFRIKTGGLALNAATTEIACNGNTNGAINISPLSGTAPYTYVWNTGSTSSSINNLSPGTYTVNVVSSEGCVGTKTINLTQPTLISITPNITDANCSNNGAIDLFVTGGSYPYSYLWSNGATTSSINNLSPSTYTATITDAHNCVQQQANVVAGTGVVSMNQPSDISVCVSTAINVAAFTGTAGATYTWTNNNTSIGLGASGVGNIPVFTAASTPKTAIITVTPSLNGCIGSSYTFTIATNNKANVTSNFTPTVCPGVATQVYGFQSNPVGATYTWTNNNASSGLAASGTGSVPSFVPTNNTAAAIVSTITVIPSIGGCVGFPKSTSTITVTQKPIINQPADVAPVCPGTVISIPAFTSPNGASSYYWTNALTPIGLGSVGTVTSNITPFTSVNNTATNYVATVYVTPKIGTCAGDIKSFTVTVFPKPSVTNAYTQTICAGNSTTAMNFASNVSGATFTWVNDNTATGLTASGVGNLAPCITTNNALAAITSNITVTPYANGCAGTTKNSVVTVNPIPTVNTTANIGPVCFGTSITVPAFTSAYTGVTYSWTNSPSSIGIASSGTGNIPTFTANNLTTNLLTATVSVTPKIGTCAGAIKAFTVKVNPKIIVDAGIDVTICPGATPTLTASSATTGLTYSWTPTTSITPSNGNGQSVVVSPAGNTTYSVTGTTGSGCFATDQVLVSINTMCDNVSRHMNENNLENIGAQLLDVNEFILSVYPNPNNGSFFIKTNNMNDIKSIRLTGIDGSLIKELEKSSDQQFFGLNSGMYIVEVNYNNGVSKHKRVIVN